VANNLSSDLSIKLAALFADLAAFSIEDIAAVKAAGVLGDNVTDNIANLQKLAESIDDETIQLLNDARDAEGLPPL
jgi:predicted DNA repair protein MutK